MAILGYLLSFSTKLWGRKHLNWTLFILSMLFYADSLIATAVVGTVVGTSLQEYATIIGVIQYCVVLAMIIIAAVWHLRQKGRSLWNLAYLLLAWISLAIMFFMENKNPYAEQASPMKESTKRVWGWILFILFLIIGIGYIPIYIFSNDYMTYLVALTMNTLLCGVVVVNGWKMAHQYTQKQLALEPSNQLTSPT
jgi:hypothetical protein